MTEEFIAASVPAIDEEIGTLDREVISNPDAEWSEQNQALLRQLALLEERTVRSASHWE